MVVMVTADDLRVKNLGPCRIDSVRDVPNRFGTDLPTTATETRAFVSRALLAVISTVG